LSGRDSRKKTIEPATRQGAYFREESRGGRWEWLGLALLLAAGLLPRLAFVAAFPTRPISDFRALVDFGLRMRDQSVFVDGFYWDLLGPGVPLTLSLLLRLFPASPESTARLATAIATGLLPLLPYLIWRGVQPRWARLTAGFLLALWPGQIAFSGVVAQDNWVLLPVVALGALAVRSAARRRGHPVAAGVLYAVGVAVRQEMMVVLLPLLLLAAVGVRAIPGDPGDGTSWRWRRALAVCVLTFSGPLLLLALQRQAATGRFALTTKHAGVSLLGSYIPGSTADGWADPIPYVAAVEPALLEDLERLRREASRLALREALARPLFHAERITAFTLDALVESESANLVWSLSSPDVLPAAEHPRAVAFTRAAAIPLRVEMAILLALFLAAVALTWWDPAVWALGASIVFKVGLHAIAVSQGRFYLAVTALEMLVIVLGVREAARRSSFRAPAAALAGSALFAAGVFLVAPRAVDAVRRRDIVPQRAYRFSLSGRGLGPRVLDCRIDRGQPTAIGKTGATLELFHVDPDPGETAAADCVLRPSAAPTILRLLDPYAPGGLPGRVMQRVTVDGRDVFVHDVAAEPGSGWTEIPLPATTSGKGTAVRIELTAIRPDPGAAWGRATATPFELSQPQPQR
jgi:hypothetical protein